MIEPFQIASVPVGSAAIGLCRLPGRSGELAADLNLIRHWNPALVVSMTETPEMNQLGARELTGELALAGIGWRHFPIADFGTPDAGTAGLWGPLSADLHQRLNTGGKVLLHCRGGLGRSGMVALRLMIEREEDAAEALHRLRLARPGAVETQAQLAWAITGAATEKG